jgi:hypothetical protein
MKRSLHRLTLLCSSTTGVTLSRGEDEDEEEEDEDEKNQEPTEKGDERGRGYSE